MKTTIPKIPKSYNRLLKMHWGARHRERKVWIHWLAVTAGYPPRNYERKKRELRITVYRCGKLQDPTNFDGSLKPIPDALKHMGWIVDDDHEWIDAFTEELKCKRKDQRTVIEIT